MLSVVLERYRRLHPTSARLYEQGRRLFPDGVTHDTRYLPPFPIYMAHAEGARKWDVDGNEYVDYVSGHGALLLGHAHPAIVEAVSGQVARGTHLGGSHQLELTWANWVQRLVPSAERVRFTSSGTEATMMALRLARAFTGKNRIVKLREHFHGWHDYLAWDAADGAVGIPGEVVSTVVALPPDVDAVERYLQRDRDVAAVILEPTGAHMGRLPLEPRFLTQLREITQRHGALLVFDEVVTGFRVAPGGAQDRYGVRPDLTTLAKVLAGGLPGGAVVGREEVMALLEHREGRPRMAHPGTFNANPLSAAAGSACLELVSSRQPNDAADAAALALRRGLNELFSRLEIAGCCYGVASLLHLRLGGSRRCEDHELCLAPHEELEAAMPPGRVLHLRRAFLNAGVDLMGGRTLIVSAAHRPQDIQRTLAAFEEALKALRAEAVL